MGDDQAWPEVPGLDDWYDNAIKAGQGFKSDKEREDYIKSIGDPMKHPLFAESTEDLEGNPLAEALRALREEDKTPIEIAMMYKEEGNDWLKKGDKKSLHEAHDRYTHALNILNRTAAAAVSGASAFDAATGTESLSDQTKSPIASLYPLELSMQQEQQLSIPSEVDKERNEEEIMLRSQILSNRAMVSLILMNYGDCIHDTDASILCWHGNIKAHYRKCISLVALRKFKEGIHCCKEGLLVEPDNVQILSLKDKCVQELVKLEKLQREISDKHQKVEQHWASAWSIMSAAQISSRRKTGAVGVVAGYASASQNPAQLQEVLPHYTVEDTTVASNVSWPVILLYPQYGQIDVIQGVNCTDMLAVHLAEMFPELADLRPSGEGAGLAVPWDRDGEYQVSQLAVYAPLEAVPRISALEQWLLSCREQSALRGELGSEAREAAIEVARQRSEVHESKLSAYGSSSGAKYFDRVGFLDVHIGATFEDILHAPGHVLAGGLLTLLVFVRGNTAHSNFLRDVRRKGHGLWSLGPKGATAPLT